MGDLTCTPWRRYGHDRVYVARGAVRLGYLNRATTDVVLDDEAVRADVVAALVAGGYLDAAPSAPALPAPALPAPALPRAAAAVPPPVPAPAAPAPAEVEWAVTLPGDTATFRAGAGAREQARAAREAAPIRTALARVLGVHTDERAWRVGADGEEAVAKRLAKLPPGWTVVHDLPIGRNDANIDHLVCGPGGVWTLNTKNLSGNVWVGGSTFLTNGHRTDYVPKARAEARRAAKVLTTAVGAPVKVGALLVVLADEVKVKQQPPDVTVVTRREVVRWLRGRPVVLDPAAAERIVRAIRDPRTWRPA